VVPEWGIFFLEARERLFGRQKDENGSAGITICNDTADYARIQEKILLIAACFCCVSAGTVVPKWGIFFSGMPAAVA
jgi:hypothetical protein